MLEKFDLLALYGAIVSTFALILAWKVKVDTSRQYDEIAEKFLKRDIENRQSASHEKYVTIVENAVHELRDLSDGLSAASLDSLKRIKCVFERIDGELEGKRNISEPSAILFNRIIITVRKAYDAELLGMSGCDLFETLWATQDLELWLERMHKGGRVSRFLERSFRSIIDLSAKDKLRLSRTLHNDIVEMHRRMDTLGPSDVVEAVRNCSLAYLVAHESAYPLLERLEKSLENITVRNTLERTKIVDNTIFYESFKRVSGDIDRLKNLKFEGVFSQDFFLQYSSLNAVMAIGVVLQTVADFERWGSDLPQPL